MPRSETAPGGGGSLVGRLNPNLGTERGFALLEEKLKKKKKKRKLRCELFFSFSVFFFFLLSILVGLICANEVGGGREDTFEGEWRGLRERRGSNFFGGELD